MKDEAKPGGGEDAKKKAFQRARKELVEREAVAETDGGYLPTPEKGPWPELVEIVNSPNPLWGLKQSSAADKHPRETG